MARRMTFDEAVEFGLSLPESIFYDKRGRPSMSRAEWEQLGRWRRLFDRALGRHPPEVDPHDLPWSTGDGAR